MQTFHNHVRAANWHFTLSRSSLRALIAALGGPYVSANGPDMRNLNRVQLEAIQAEIWPQGVGVQNDPWQAKKRKYHLALGYLAQRLYNLLPADALLIGTYKAGWLKRPLAQNLNFVTSSGAMPADLANSGGLSTDFASELCIPHGGMIGDWDEHKMVFCKTMAVTAEGKLTRAGLIGRQGFGANVYCFTRRSGTHYYAPVVPGSHRNANAEIAFPDRIKIRYIHVCVNGDPAVNNPWICDKFDPALALTPDSP